MDKIITPAVVFIIGIGFAVVPFVAYLTREEPEPAVGGFGDSFLSVQVGTDPDNGDCLTTDGTDSTWDSCSGDVATTTLTGDVTGSGTTSITTAIASGVIVEDDLSVTNSPTDNYILSFDNGSGGFTWVQDQTSDAGNILATTSPWTAGNLAVVVDDATIKSVGTSTLSEDITGLEFDASPIIVGSARTLSLTTGYSIPLTASTTEWATAYASTTALTPAYIRGLFSNTATGLTYNSSTGATSLTANYVIPLTASTTEWHNFHTTPSGRITAGTNLTWSGNTLNLDNPVVADLTGNADTATALAGNGANCSAGNYPLGVDASGAVEDCTADANTTYTAGDHLTLTGTDFDVDDDFLLNTGDTGSGAYSFTGTIAVTGTSTLATTTITNLLGMTSIDSTSITTIENAFDTVSAALETAIEAALDTLNNLDTVAILTSLSIPFGSNPTADGVGDIAHDTTDNQLILDDHIIRTADDIYKFSIGSTSPAFASSTSKRLPAINDGYTVTNILCSVEGGTSKIILLYGESITCDADGATDDGSIASATLAANASTTLQMGATSGTVHWLNVTIKATYTRE